MESEITFDDLAPHMEKSIAKSQIGPYIPGKHYSRLGLRTELNCVLPRDAFPSQTIEGITVSELVDVLEHADEIRAGTRPKFQLRPPLSLRNRPKLNPTDPRLKELPQNLQIKYAGRKYTVPAVKFAFEAWRYPNN